jgi:serine/threonine-protein kinase
MFACTEERLPALFSRLSATVRVEGGEQKCWVEVVRHGRAAEMACWGMPAGFGVQFIDPPAGLKEVISRLLQGEVAPRPTPARGTPLPPKDDAAVAKVLAELLAREAMDPYAVLDLSRNVSMEDVRERARAERRRLEALKERPLSSLQQEKLARCLEQLEWAASLLGNPARRARYDAGIGNFRGVARCIIAGLSLPELEALRSRFMAENRGVETKATVLALTAGSFEAQGQWDKALEQYELALALDPLRLELHQKYSKLMRQEEARRHREAVSADALGTLRPPMRPGVASRGLPMDDPRADRGPTE